MGVSRTRELTVAMNCRVALRLPQSRLSCVQCYGLWAEDSYVPRDVLKHRGEASMYSVQEKHYLRILRLTGKWRNN